MSERSGERNENTSISSGVTETSAISQRCNPGALYGGATYRSRPPDTTTITMHKCATCGRVFTRRFTLQRHASGCRPKPFVCTVCDSSFGRKQDLDRHKRTVQCGGPPQPVGPAPKRRRIVASLNEDPVLASPVEHAANDELSSAIRDFVHENWASVRTHVVNGPVQTRYNHRLTSLDTRDLHDQLFLLFEEQTTAFKGVEDEGEIRTEEAITGVEDEGEIRTEEMITGDEGEIRTEDRKEICSGATLMATHAYTRNPDSPIGKEIDLQQWETLVFKGLQAENEHWRLVEDTHGQVGYAPAAFLVVILDTTAGEEENDATKKGQVNITEENRIGGRIGQEGERRKSYSAAVIDGKKRKDTIYVGDSIMRKTDSRLSKGEDVVVCLPGARIEHVTERVEKIMGRGNGGSILVHVGTNNADKEGTTAIVEKYRDLLKKTKQARV